MGRAMSFTRTSSSTSRRTGADDDASAASASMTSSAAATPRGSEAGDHINPFSSATVSALARVADGQALAAAQASLATLREDKAALEARAAQVRRCCCAAAAPALDGCPTMPAALRLMHASHAQLQHRCPAPRTHIHLPLLSVQLAQDNEGLQAALAAARADVEAARSETEAAHDEAHAARAAARDLDSRASVAEDSKVAASMVGAGAGAGRVLGGGVLGRHLAAGAEQRFRQEGAAGGRLRGPA